MIYTAVRLSLWPRILGQVSTHDHLPVIFSLRGHNDVDQSTLLAAPCFCDQAVAAL